MRLVIVACENGFLVSLNAPGSMSYESQWVARDGRELGDLITRLAPEQLNRNRPQQGKDACYASEARTSKTI